MRARSRSVSQPALERFVTRGRRAVGVRGEVNVLITRNAEIRRLNRAFRHKDKPTDVLSFPAGTNDIAGDIAISADIAAANARRLGHTLADELRVLILHGLLHHAGYDHESDAGEMQRKEERLRVALDLPQALIGRTHARPKTRAVTKRTR